MRLLFLLIVLNYYSLEIVFSQDTLASSIEDTVKESTFNISISRKAFINEINKYRQENFLEPLETRSDLNIFAQSHSDKMILAKAMFHSDLSCECSFGECVMISHVWGRYIDLARQTTRAFMKSSTHHDILMTRDAQYIGIGIEVRSSFIKPYEGVDVTIREDLYTITLVLD